MDFRQNGTAISSDEDRRFDPDQDNRGRLPPSSTPEDQNEALPQAQPRSPEPTDNLWHRLSAGWLES